MPRFFFHMFDDAIVTDDEGLDLPDADAARREAMAGVRAMLCDQILKGRLPLSHRVEVEDEAGLSVLSLSFGQAIRIEP